MDFVWWLVRAGLARPQGFNGSTLFAFDMTPAGLRLLDSGDDHPLAPGFLLRLRQRHPDLPEDVLLLIEDARSCLDFSLLRPAIVLLGVAFETAVEQVLMNLATKGLAAADKIRKSDAGERIAQLKKLLNKLQFTREDRRLADAAVDFADHLRERRNDAAHTKPRWPFSSTEEIEEMIVSGGRHLPRLWEITKATPTESANA